MRRLLCVLSAPVRSGKARHYRISAGAGLAGKQELPPPWLLVIETDADKPERGALLYRFDRNGECVGDTWHESIEAAKEHAGGEYEKAARTWREVPADIGIDALAMAELAADHDNR